MHEIGRADLLINTALSLPSRRELLSQIPTCPRPANLTCPTWASLRHRAFFKSLTRWTCVTGVTTAGSRSR